MKALLLYYTGTFNTLYLTLKIKKKLEKIGYEVKTFEIVYKKDAISLSNYDLIGFGYPIYAFNSPKTFNQYLKKLILNPQAKYFIFKQSGETFKYNNSSSRIIKKILRKNRCNLVNEKHYIMPYNIHFRFKDSFAKELLEYDNKLLEILIVTIILCKALCLEVHF